jgi:hypothetical protein
MVDPGEDGDTAGGMQLRSHGHGEVTTIRLCTSGPLTIAGCITCQNFGIALHTTQKPDTTALKQYGIHAHT